MDIVNFPRYIEDNKHTSDNYIITGIWCLDKQSCKLKEYKHNHSN